MINSFRGKYYFLSNMYPLDNYIVDGFKFHCVEQAFQAHKIGDEDREYWLGRMLKTTDGFSAKRIGKVVPIRPCWEDLRVKVMRKLIAIKFQNPVLAEQLKATGAQELIEGNAWGDTFWGQCNGRGENMLGQILMEVRESLDK